MAKARPGAQISPAGLQARLSNCPVWCYQMDLALPTWPEPVGLHLVAEAQLMLWLFSFSSLSTPVMEPPALVVPWLLCRELGVCLFSFGIHMAPGEPETSSVPASASPAFLLIDSRERYLSPGKLFPWFKRVIFSDVKSIF